MDKYICLKCDFILICQYPGGFLPADCIEESKAKKINKKGVKMNMFNRIDKVIIFFHYLKKFGPWVLVVSAILYVIFKVF